MLFVLGPRIIPVKRTPATDRLTRAIIQAITIPLTTRLTAILQATTVQIPAIWADMAIGSRSPLALGQASILDSHMDTGSESGADWGSPLDNTIQWNRQQILYYPPPYPFNKRLRRKSNV
uniref:Uncharacterized protein n=1 Tax=Panagrolaimus sp. ES5 TaxID=591445 RepID=A0AC34GTH9_9BILA